MNKFIHTDIKGNVDNYKWDELNCFYKAFAIALGCKEEKYFNSLLLYFASYILYGIKGEGYMSFNADDCILKYYAEELEDIYGSCLKKEEVFSHSSMCKKMYKLLKENKVLVIPCDLFYLPYCKTYLELHRRHYIIVKGIDLEKNIVYIIDNMHIEFGASTKYRDFMLDTKNLYKMIKSFSKYYDNTKSNIYFWSVEINKNERYEETSNSYFLRLSRFILDNKKYLEIDILNAMNKGYIYIDKYKYLFYANMRNVFFKSLKMYIYEKNKQILVDEVISAWKKIKYYMMFVYEKDKIDLQKIHLELCNVIEMEKNIIKDAQKYVLRNTSSIKNKNKDYRIINKKDALVKCYKYGIEIILDEFEIYDIWKNCEDGVIIQVNHIRKQLQGIINIDTEFGSSSFVGIYIELLNGSRIMFGSLGRMNVAVHIISDCKDYEPFIYQKIIDDELEIGIKIEDEYCGFYIGRCCVYSIELESKISQMGYFAKTWENCYCRIKIYDKI